MGSDEADLRWRSAMAAAQAGDATAYHELLKEILPVIRRQVNARLAGDPVAEDVVQNVLISIHRARHTYRPERPFGPWMRAIVRNAVIDSFRERRRQVQREVAVEAPELLVDPDSGGEPESAELSPELAKALAQLPAKQRQGR